MAFSGRVEEVSHMRGYWHPLRKVPQPWRYYQVSEGGKILGRVDTVIGPVDSGLVHIHPVSRGVEVDLAIGSPVEIAPRRARDKRGGNRHRDGKNTSRNEGGADPEMMEKEEVPVMLEGEEILGKRGGVKRGRSPRYDGRGSRKNSRGRGRGEESRASTWCFKHNREIPSRDFSSLWIWFLIRDSNTGSSTLESPLMESYLHSMMTVSRSMEK